MAARKPIIFQVPGQPEVSATRGAAAAQPSYGLTVKHAVRVGLTRGEATPITIDAIPGEDIVVLQIDGGPELVMHPEHARDLLQAQSGPSQRGRRAGASANEIIVPVRLQWSGMAESPAQPGTSRGMGGVLLSAMRVLTGRVGHGAADAVADAIVRRVDSQVDAGLYPLSADELGPLKGRPRATIAATDAGDPLLVLIHGTFSTTAGTFAKLWVNHPEHVRTLFKQYGGRVYALDHPTLGVSPIANALTLAEALPRGAHVHLLTHSRGGLVAEVLARICADPGDEFTEFAGRDYRTQRAQLQALASTVRRKGITVDRIVRVACPARGTLLASNRIDAYISVFKWTLELAGLPVAAELLDFLTTIAQRRTDPTLIPGLAAQMPDSPLVRWLHSVERQVGGQLRVIAGDLQGDSVGSWLKTLLTDAFYWTDHDLVVQTRSMYGGVPRETASTFVLDQGGKVTHFNYFSNARTAQALTNALLQERPQDFSVIGPLSWAGASATGTRARVTRRAAAAAADKPAVFILPGMLGSNLRVGTDRIWISWRLVNGLHQLAYVPGKANRVEPDGLVGAVYEDLAAFLSATHQVIQFPFDWRRPMQDEARRLGEAVTAALDARQRSGQAVRIVAHSMGGLVARTMRLELPKVWARLMARSGSRVLLLGTPNGGSFAPMQVLSGDDTFGNLMAMVGSPFQEHAARAQMATFPGFLQLQAGLLGGDMPLARVTTWQKLADADRTRAEMHSAWHHLPIQLDALRWGIPNQKALDAAAALRRRLDAQVEHLGSLADRLLLVVGQAPFTPGEFEITGRGVVYTGTTTGDGRVTLDSAMLPGIRTWRVPCDHAHLPQRKEAFAAYRELLDTGSTALIEALPEEDMPREGAGRVTPVYSRPARSPQKAYPPRSEEQAIETSGAPRDGGDTAPAGPPLRVTVENGDLTFVPYPLLLGHYRSMRLTGTERVMDSRIGHLMEQSLRVGTYPDGVGSNRVFINARANPDNPLQLPRPEAVIVVGLGEEAKLRGADLARAVRQGVLAWAERNAERRSEHPSAEDVPAGSRAFRDGGFEIAATLIGSGGTGISVGQSAQLVVQGVCDANDRLAQEHASHEGRDGDWPVLRRVTRLHLIELYLDRASEALRALHLQMETSPGRFVVDDVIESGTGGLERPVDASYRGADYDFISALTRPEPDGTSSIEYTLDTRRARTEVRAQQTQSTLLGHLVSLASNDANTDPKIGRTLFQLLVPAEIEPYLAGATEMQIEVDSGTAGIPWELLDTGRDAVSNGGAARQPDSGEPWAVRAKVLRKLRVENPPQRPDAGADGSVLVIGEPKCDPNQYPRLYGARAEARQVAECLGSNTVLGRDRVQALISPDDPLQFGPDAREVLNALFDRDRTWRIVHISGHGEPAHGTEGGGVVLSDGFLSAKEISAMRVVPELVFVNCCHLAARSGDQLLRGTYDRARFAAGVAEELITIGVRCVVAAGWAVDDAAAGAFATTFYGSLLGGRRFLDAVADARKAALTFGGNTWAAYQCYGDPDWTFRRDTPDSQRPSLDEQFQGVLSASSLERAVTTLAVQSEFQGAAPDMQRDRLRYLEERAKQLAPEWLRAGCVAEAFGRASAAADDLRGAMRWYESAVAAPDGTASMKAAEELANLRARIAANADPATARREIGEAIRALQTLVAVHATLERESFLGSAYKRLAMVEAAAGNAQAEAAALADMQKHYARAEQLASDDPAAEFFYPALNRMAAELAINAGTRGWRGLAPAVVTRVRDELQDRARTDPDFWSIAGQADLRLFEALSQGSLNAVRYELRDAWVDLHGRVPSQHKWKSVYDTAHLVLSKYIVRTSGPERDAARETLHLLAGFAGVERETRAGSGRRRAAGPRSRSGTSHRKRSLGRKRRRRA